MKKSSEYFKQFNKYYFEMNAQEAFVKVVKEAMCDTIKVCAEEATPDFNADKYHNKLRVDKQSILNLINQVI